MTLGCASRYRDETGGTFTDNFLTTTDNTDTAIAAYPMLPVATLCFEVVALTQPSPEVVVSLENVW